MAGAFMPRSWQVFCIVCRGCIAPVCLSLEHDAASGSAFVALCGVCLIRTLHRLEGVAWCIHSGRVYVDRGVWVKKRDSVIVCFHMVCL